MQWTDLQWVSEQQKVARLTSAGDLLACSGQIAVFAAGDAPPAVRAGVWVSATPMTETVKRVDDEGFVVETVPREELRVVGYPIVVPASLAQRAASPDDLLRLATATGQARAL